MWQGLAAATVHGCNAADTARHPGQAEASDSACQGHEGHPGCRGQGASSRLRVARARRAAHVGMGRQQQPCGLMAPR